jgi:hypothetical protein
MAMKKYEVRPLDTKYFPKSVPGAGVTFSPITAAPDGQVFDSHKEAEEFASAATKRDTEKRYVFTVDEIEVP